jgi:Na+/H+ antiporter NhaD/arsenite permease-like protein
LESKTPFLICASGAGQGWTVSIAANNFGGIPKGLGLKSDPPVLAVPAQRVLDYRICHSHGSDLLHFDDFLFKLLIILEESSKHAQTMRWKLAGFVISVEFRIGYTDFLLHLRPIALVGLGINWLVLRLMCAKDLARELEEQSDFAPMSQTMPRPLGADVARAVCGPDRSVWKPVVITLGVLLGFLLGFSPALVSISGAILLLMSRRTNPRDLYRDVDWSLLLFFAGLFLILGGAETVHITDYLLAVARHLNLENTAIFATVVGLLSNLVSNVPAVMLLRPVMTQFHDPRAAWLSLSMATTLAGNLTITGSVANIIVVENARSAVHISFKDYLRVGVPITLLTLFFGIAWFHFAP